MTLQLFGHSFTAYTRKALIALDEKGRAYDTRMLGPERSDNSAELARRGPIRSGMIRLIAGAPRQRHVLTLSASDPGLRAYVFTFGP